MDYLILFLLLIGCIMEYFSFCYVIFRVPFRRPMNKIIVSGIATCAILAIFGGLVLKPFWFIYFAALVNVVFMYINIKLKFKELLKLIIVAFVTLIMLESVLAHIIKYFFIRDDNVITFAYEVCIIILLWLFYWIAGHKLEKDAFELHSGIWGIVIGILVLLDIMISFFVFVLTEIVSPKGEYMGVVFTTTGGLAILVLSYVMVYYHNVHNKSVMRAELLEEYNEQQRLYFEQLLQKEQETKQFRHDIIAELLQMQNYLEKGEEEKLSEYLNEMLQGISLVSKSDYDVGNEIVNTMLNYYLNPVKNQCDIRIKGYVSDELDVDPRDLCIVVSNLIRNSIEAVDKIVNGTRKIQFEIKEGEHFLYINTQNTFLPEMMLSADSGVLTTKNDKVNHGFGLINVKKVVDKYNGKYNNYISEEQYITEIYLTLHGENRLS